MGFLANRNRNGSEKVFGAGLRVFGGWEFLGGFWCGKFLVGFGVFGGWEFLGVFGVFGPKYGKNASKSVVFGNSCN